VHIGEIAIVKLRQFVFGSRKTSNHTFVKVHDQFESQVVDDYSLVIGQIQ
jgi:hypothetical protein